MATRKTNTQHPSLSSSKPKIRDKSSRGKTTKSHQNTNPINSFHPLKLRFPSLSTFQVIEKTNRWRSFFEIDSERYLAHYCDKFYSILVQYQKDHQLPISTREWTEENTLAECFEWIVTEFEKASPHPFKVTTKGFVQYEAIEVHENCIRPFSVEKIFSIKKKYPSLYKCLLMVFQLMYHKTEMCASDCQHKEMAMESLRCLHEDKVTEVKELLEGDQYYDGHFDSAETYFHQLIASFADLDEMEEIIHKYYHGAPAEFAKDFHTIKVDIEFITDYCIKNTSHLEIKSWMISMVYLLNEAKVLSDYDFNPEYLTSIEDNISIHSMYFFVWNTDDYLWNEIEGDIEAMWSNEECNTPYHTKVITLKDTSDLQSDEFLNEFQVLIEKGIKLFSNEIK